ncbi:MAG: tRNA lysidine(34) synthetase TilS [Parvularculaceae bacterium]|nr:tRNA lysidine(34) synthetase TilS [Parvularculaceae bacterium]
MALAAESETPPLTAAGFRAIWRRLGAPRRMVLALSGGADSTALAHLCAPLHAHGEAQILAVTINHGLRAGAAEEATRAGGFARALGLPHQVLTWEGEKPASGVQAAARVARYRLLIAAAESFGASTIMTAHHADDQAETVLMRMKRGGGPRGLSAMSETSFVAAGAGPAMVLARPLLGYRRAALVALLHANVHPFIEDPSNADPAFERVRVRRELAAGAGPGFDALIDMSRRAAATAAEDERRERAAFDDLNGRFHPWGGASFLSREAPADAALAARLIHAVGGGAHRPDHNRARVAMGVVATGRRASLGGALVRQWRGRTWVLREPAAVLGRAGVAPAGVVTLAPGARTCWDRRFVVANSGDEALTLGALAAAPDVENAGVAGFDGPAEAKAAMPVLVGAGGRIADPCGGGKAFEALAPERFYRCVNRFH